MRTTNRRLRIDTPIDVVKTGDDLYRWDQLVKCLVIARVTTGI